MRIIPLNEVQQMSEGMPVEGVRAKIKSVYEQKTGTNNNGVWTLQGVTLMDASGTMTAKFVDRDEVPKAWQGREVIIACTSGQKGPSGVKAKDDKYLASKGKDPRVLWVTSSAQVELAGQSSPQQPQQPAQAAPERPAAHAPAPAGEPAPSTDAYADSQARNGNGGGSTNGRYRQEYVEPPPQAPKNPDDPSVDKEAKRHITRFCNLWIQCMIAAGHIRDKWDTMLQERVNGGEATSNRPMTDDQFQSCVATMMIHFTDGKKGTNLLPQVSTGKFHE